VYTQLLTVFNEIFIKAGIVTALDLRFIGEERMHVKIQRCGEGLFQVIGERPECPGCPTKIGKPASLETALKGLNPEAKRKCVALINARDTSLKGLREIADVKFVRYDPPKPKPS